MAGSVSYIGIAGSGKGYTTVLLSNGTTQTFKGSRGWRNNNPGNLTSDSKSQSTLNRYKPYGAIGYDYGGNMIFSSMQGGFNAQKALVTGTYKSNTIGSMLNKYAPPGASNDPNGTNATYPAYMEAQGWDLDTKISDLTPEQQNKLIADMIRKENTTEDANKILEQVDPENVSDEAGSSPIQNEPEGEDTVSDKSGQGTAGTSSPRSDISAPSSSSSSGSSGSSASGGEVGFKDPDKTYPIEEHEQEQETNFASRGEWEPKIKDPPGHPYEIPRDAQPEYPHNKVIESTNPNIEERHRIEIDDTPAGERLTMVHKKGTGIEMWEDGQMIVNTAPDGKMVQLVGADFEMFVAGNGTVIYKGNLDWTVEGDMNLTVKGNMNTTVEGNKKEVVKRKKIEEYQDDQETTVTNNKSTTVGETHNELNLGDKYTSVKKVSNMWTEGDVEFISDNNIHFSTKEKMSISANTFNMTASVAQWHANSGNIGGPLVYYYGYAYDGDLRVLGNVEAEGDLIIDGDAYVVGNGSFGGGGSFGGNGSFGGGISAQDSIATASDLVAFATGVSSPTSFDGTDITDQSSIYKEPTSSQVINTTLTASDEGIRNVSIDPGDKIKQTIDIRERVALGLGL